MSKLALGTAQFGLKYGIANESGQIKKPDAREIIKFAKEENINLIDTAMSYGESEKVIGEIGVADFKIVSKLSNLPQECDNVEFWVEKNVQHSLSRLGLRSLYGLLIHNTKDLLGSLGKRLINALNFIKSKGLIKKIGISIYDPSELDHLMDLTTIDIVQAPLNIIDQRLVTSGWLYKLHKSKVEVHTRSVFLQGLLLMPKDKIPTKFQRWSKLWNNWSSELKKNNLSAIEACLSYSLSLPEINHVLVGVDNIDQFKDLIKKSQKKKNLPMDWSFMISSDQKLINPFNWSSL